MMLNICKDPSFTFDPECHIYTLSGNIIESASTVSKRFQPKFDTEYWSRRKADERGVTRRVILDEWEQKRNIGSNVHSMIEYFWKRESADIDIEILDNEMEYYDRFLDFYRERLFRLEPIAQELRVYSKKYQIGGTIDAVFKIEDTYIIADWKTGTRFKTDEDKNSAKLKRPFSKDYNNEHNRYSLQLSIYALILEEWGIKTKWNFVCYLGHPPGIYSVKDYREKLREVLENDRKRI